MTPLSPPEHEHSAAIDEAAQWLIDTPPHQRQGALVPQLRGRFGLSAIEAIAAIKEHRLRLARAA